MTGPTSTRSSHHTPASHGSSQSSLYLSPPVTDSETENPPYIPRDDDNNSLNMHTNRKKRKKAMYRRRDEPVTLEDMDNLPGRLTMANRIRPRVSAAGSSRSYSSHSDDSFSFEPRKIDQHIITSTIIQASPVRCDKTGIAISIDNLIGGIQNDSCDFSTDKPRGCRSAGTERLSPGTTLDMSRGWTVIGDSVILSPPIATACVENLFEPSLLVSSRTAIKDSATTKHRIGTASKVKSRAYRDGHRRRLSTNDGKPETPATITLRKASNNYHREKPGRIFRNEKVHIAKRSAAGQIGSMTFLQDASFVNSHPKANEIFSIPLNEESNASVISPVSPRSCALLSTSTSSSDRPLLRRQTITADPALTFAEVLTTPEVFPSSSASRKHSLLAIHTMRRSSAVMIRSGNSIHEIIWDKDDAPSSSSSRPSLYRAESADSSETQSLDGSPRKASTGCHRFQNPDISRPASRDTEVSGNIEGPHALQKAADRSRTTQEADKDYKKAIGRSAIGEALEGEAISCTKAKKCGRWSKSWGTNISNSMQGVESFPPLLERGSTYEWRKVPLVDINDPIAGRSDEPAPETNSVNKNSVEAMKVAQDEQTDLVSMKQSDAADHRSWAGGKLGIALGTSSHHRRPSAGPHQQGPYSSLVDLSKSVSRRASKTIYGSLDKALDLAVDRCEPPPERRLSKSANPLADEAMALPDSNMEFKRSGFQSSYAAQRTAPVWRKASNGGLRINTASMMPDSRVLGVAGLSEVAEDEVEYKA
ncbi:hypothetical protein MMC11_002107 [Xylographa trunciseda]|nr:hypothetical protein [Xylographa trunciseda]